MGVAIYNAMPLPDAGFQPRRISEPGRNEPCLCRSGEKYKRCCLPLAGKLDLGGYNMLRHILDTLPKKHFTELPASRVDPIAVYDTARQWQEEGDPDLADMIGFLRAVQADPRAAMAVDALQTMGAGASILELLLGRATALLDANLDAGAPGDGTLQWSWQENRPALRDAAHHHRAAIEMLLAAAPKQPRPDAGYGITVGGKEEAWEYRAAHRSLWEQDGALGWLGAAWRDVRKAVPRRGQVRHSARRIASR